MHAISVVSLTYLLTSFVLWKTLNLFPLILDGVRLTRNNLHPVVLFLPALRYIGINANQIRRGQIFTNDWPISKENRNTDTENLVFDGARRAVTDSDRDRDVANDHGAALFGGGRWSKRPVKTPVRPPHISYHRNGWLG